MIKVQRTQDWIERRLAATARALEYANAMISGGDTPLVTTISASLTYDRYQFVDGEALGLIQAAISMRLKGESLERIKDSREWLMNYGTELKEQLALLNNQKGAG